MKNVIILGGGVSGIAAKRLAEKLGYSAQIITDDECSTLPECDLIIASPGVPPLKSPLYRQALASSAEFIGELEFGFRHFPRPVIAITGTNGKTTTTGLLTHIFNRCGINAVSAGNIGVPLSDIACCRELPEVAVVEVSSFQLELNRTFAPAAAALLNTASDHIDRYAGGFSEYCAVKERIFDRVPPNRQVRGRSFGTSPENRAAVRNGNLYIDGEFFLALAETDLPGPPNEENLLAAVELLCRFAPELPFRKRELFTAAVKSFRRERHRIETVACRDNITYVDDSKGTNPAAVVAAANSFPGALVMLMGGLAKDMDFSIIVPLAKRFRAVVLYGRDREVIARILDKCTKCVDCGNDFQLAVSTAKALAMPGDTVLLSPGCASMDMFTNYKERGDKFRELVLQKL